MIRRKNVKCKKKNVLNYSKNVYNVVNEKITINQAFV